MKKNKEFTIEHISEQRNKLLLERALITEQRRQLRSDIQNASLIKLAENGFTKIKPTLIRPATYNFPPEGRLDVHIADFHYKGEDDEERAYEFFSQLLGTIRTTWNKKQTIRVAFLGDDIEGELHASSHDKHQKETTVNQIIGVSRHYISFLDTLAKIVGKKASIEVAFVPESNHGQLRFHGMQRGEAPRNDVGYIIRDNLMRALDGKMKFWEADKGIVETDDTFYMHGDKAYMKTSEKVRLKLGTKKHIIMGHFHRTKTTDHGTQWVICVPKASPNVETYSEEAGYNDGIAKAMLIRHNKDNKIVGFDIMEVDA